MVQRSLGKHFEPNREQVKLGIPFSEPPSGGEELVRLLPDARLVVIEDSGHMPWLEAPDEFFPPVLEFLLAERS